MGFSIAACLFFPHLLPAQASPKLDSLYGAQKKLDREISMLSQARDSAKAKKDNTHAELQLINRQVAAREALLGGITAQLREIDLQITSTEAVIQALEGDILKVKEQYARLMVATYKALHQKNASFYVMSAKSVTQAYQRMQYFKAIGRMQEAQIRMLRRTKAFLAQKRILLSQQKVEKEQIAVTERLEREKLVVLKDEQKVVYDRFKAEEAKILKELQAKEGERQKLVQEVQKEIDRIRLAKKKKIETAPKPEVDIVKKLDKDFATNKGSLPWPIPMPSASITRHFGKQTLPGSTVEIDALGIDIQTSPGQAVRAIFSGTVESVMSIPGQGKMVIISHGNYYTTFANLATVSVKVGNKVDGLGTIGTARTDPASGETKVYFQLNHDRAAVNPEEWLAKKS